MSDLEISPPPRTKRNSMPRKIDSQFSHDANGGVVKRQHQLIKVNSSSVVPNVPPPVISSTTPPKTKEQSPNNVITCPATSSNSSFASHYKPIGKNSNTIVNRLPPPHPSSQGNIEIFRYCFKCFS